MLHMNPQYPSLVFPDTDIFNVRQFPLMLFGTPLYYLQPVESDPDRDDESDHDCFIKRGLCQALTPVPLGEHRDRFLRLIHDIKSRKDDYAAQLSALTVAALGESKQTAEGEHRHQIASSLLGQHVSNIPENNELDAKRWQARLVLAIAETLEQEESELQQELQLLDAQELEMLRSLQGDGDEDEPGPLKTLKQISGDLVRARPQVQKMRFRSWRTLMGAAPVPPVFFWLASSRDAADQIFNVYERASDHHVRPILQVPLPNHIEASEVYVCEQIETFQKDAEETIRQLCGSLGRVTLRSDLSFDSADDLLPDDTQSLTHWNELLDYHFPAGSHGRASLVFYLLPFCNIADMLHLESAHTTRAEHALLGVLKRD
jgi:hypothetical protein